MKILSKIKTSLTALKKGFHPIALCFGQCKQAGRASDYIVMPVLSVLHYSSWHITSDCSAIVIKVKCFPKHDERWLWMSVAKLFVFSLILIILAYNKHTEPKLRIPFRNFFWGKKLYTIYNWYVLYMSAIIKVLFFKSKIA